MALKIALDRNKTEIRLALPNAYVRIIDVSTRASSGEVRIDVATYADATARDFGRALAETVPVGSAGGPPAAMHDIARLEAAAVNKTTLRCKMADLRAARDAAAAKAGDGVADDPLTGPGLIRIAYLWLKAQPSYTGGEDC